MSDILVSISCITFNHALFIRKCLNSFLEQQCSFKYEILIYDDASTDGTAEIIKEYALKFPEIIKPIIQTENQFSKGVRGIAARFNMSRAKGKYIAMCEGDDYWTDILKLQKQVDFLEKNKEYTLVSGGFSSVNSVTSETKTYVYEMPSANSSQFSSDLENIASGFDITLDMMLERWLTKTLTNMFRLEAIDLNTLNQYKLSRDVHLVYHLLKAGKGYYMSSNFGVYAIHEGGIFSTTDHKNRISSNYNIFKEMYNINHDRFTRKFYQASLLKCFFYNYCNKSRFDRVKKLIKSFILVRSLDDLKMIYRSYIDYRSRT